MLNAQTTQAESPAKFYESLVNNYDRSWAPKNGEALEFADQLRQASREDVKDALPPIFRALSHEDDRVKSYAALALYSIEQRADGVPLLDSRVREIAQLLNSSSPQLQSSGVEILGGLKAREVQPILTEFLQRTDADQNAQAGAVSILLRSAPEDPKVVASVVSLLSRSTQLETRVAILNAMGTPNAQDPRIRKLVISALDSPDEGVRFTAAQVLRRIGREAVIQAEPVLERIVQRPDESTRVRNAAQDALSLLK
jgi:HEAT repeat protein